MPLFKEALSHISYSKVFTYENVHLNSNYTITGSLSTQACWKDCLVADKCIAIEMQSSGECRLYDEKLAHHANKNKNGITIYTNYVKNFFNSIGSYSYIHYLYITLAF